MVVADNRVFLSFDGEFENPGNIVEYDLKTHKSKCIASTIDRSIAWPMQGYEHPYEVAKLMPDLKNKRLLMLLHDKNKHQYKMQYTIRLWAYYWESGKWEALSNYLPTLFQNCSQLLDSNGSFWISTQYGIGPLNKKGDWQPVVAFDNRMRITAKTALGTMFENHDKVRIDYSKRLDPNAAYPAFHASRGFEMLSEKYAISDDYLFQMETRRFYRLPETLKNARLVNGRYLLTGTKEKYLTEDMLLIDLEKELY